jgi:hypothetical protein
VQGKHDGRHAALDPTSTLQSARGHGVSEQGQICEHYAGDREWQTDCGEVDLPSCPSEASTGKVLIAANSSVADA